MRNNLKTPCNKMVSTFAWSIGYIGSIIMASVLTEEKSPNAKILGIIYLSQGQSVCQEKKRKDRYKHLHLRRDDYSGHRVEWFDARVPRFKVCLLVPQCLCCL